MKRLPPGPFRGDRAGGPCAILGCAREATTQVTWAQHGRLAEHAIWYCEQDARAALERARETRHDARITVGPAAGGGSP
jgi:hypothetical protein